MYPTHPWFSSLRAVWEVDGGWRAPQMELVAGKEWLLFQAGSGPKILTSLLLKVNMEIFTAWHVPREELQPVASCM